MCNAWCLQYWETRIRREEIQGKTILEVGALDVNGSLRSLIEPLQPNRYCGIDIQDGPGVDELCRAEDILTRFGSTSFDVVVSTELIEHIQDWKRVVSNLKQVCKANGILIITTRSYGFPFHGYPHDFWRYEIQDMRNIFNDCIIEILEADQSEPGVFLKARKPVSFMENNLSGYELYAVEFPVKQQMQSQETLSFTIEKDGQKVILSEKTVMDMYHQIQRIRRMREQQTRNK